jgi:hypothetical protein
MSVPALYGTALVIAIVGLMEDTYYSLVGSPIGCKAVVVSPKIQMPV